MPSREIQRISVTQWTPGIKPTWTIAEVRSALRNHRFGDFSLSSQLVDSMGEDDLLPGLFEKRVDAVLGSDFTLCPVDAPNRQLSKRLAEQFGPLWWDMLPEGDSSEFLQWYDTLGVAIGVLDIEMTESRWMPRLRTLHPQFLRRDETRHEWFYQAQEGDLRVTPGDGTWVLVTDGRRGWMRGLVRSLAIAWIAKQLTLRDWNRYNERHGLPIIKAMAPAIADDADKDQFWDDIRAIHSETVAQLPTHLDENGAAFDLDLLEAKDQNWQAFEKHLDRCDRRFMVRVLGANLGTEVSDKGSRAAADTHRGVEQAKAKANATKLSTEWRRQVLFPACAYNVAGVTLDVVPWPEWDTEPPADDKAEAESKEAFGKAVKAVQDAGYDIDNVDELAERYDLKLTKRPVAPPPPALIPSGTQPGAAPPPNPSQSPAPTAKFGVLLASGDVVSPTSGFVEGQLYIDALTDSHAVAAEDAIAPTLTALAEELEAATDYDDLRARLHARYAKLDPDELTELVYRAMYLANLAGRAAATQDA